MKIFSSCLPAILAAATSVALLGAPRLALSQTGPPFCAFRDVLADLLRRTYGEVPRIRATEEGGRIIEFYVSPSGTWTMLVASGAVGCVGASGTNWAEADGRDTTRPEM